MTAGGTKLIEVALPLEAINQAGRAEKSVPKKGHPATLHLWWSRKPLGVARAVLFASIVDDPSARPDLFPTEEEQAAERQRLFDLTAALSSWDRSDDAVLLREVRRRIEEAAGPERPKLIDPFCGGGAIPVEGVRLGLDVLGVDLNPVAALVTASATTIAQRFAGQSPVNSRPETHLALGQRPLAGIAEDVRHYGEAVEEECQRRLADAFSDAPSHYSPSGTTTPVSYLWARTIACTNPGCRRKTPLLSTWWLSKKAKHFWHARPVLLGDDFTFTVHEGKPPDDLEDLKVSRGANFRCLFCSTINDADAVRAAGEIGELGYKLVAVQAFRDPSARRSGRVYLDPTPDIELAATDVGISTGASAAIERDLPTVSGNITAFGLRTFGDLLTPRQQLTMGTFADVIADVAKAVRRDAEAAGLPDDSIGIEKGGTGATAYAEAVTTYLGLTLSRMANRVSTMTIHNRANGSVEQSFVQPAYAFYGDFPEANPFSGSTGSWGNALEHVWRAVEALPVSDGVAEIRAASMLTALDGECGMVSTDPPYYDMFDYAALSNLFYIWLRASLGEIWPDTLGPLLAPTAEQIVSNPSRFDGSRAKAHEHFEDLLRQSFIRIRGVQDRRFPTTIYYGYQQTERSKDGRSSTAWEALLESVIDAGFRITSTWPLRTERPEGVKKGSNSLASSVLLVCRPALAQAATATATDFRRSLRSELPKALKLLQQGNIAPVDLAQAAIGPGMSVFTRFARVLEADGVPMRVRTALQMINEVLDETLEGTDNDFDPDTRWAVTWFDEYGFREGPFGRAEQLSKSRNTSMSGLQQAGVVGIGGGKARLLSRNELHDDWDPSTDQRLTVWEITQHLIRRLEGSGEHSAALLLGKIAPDQADVARELAYRLFQTCQTKGWAQEGAALNGLVVAWPELSRLAHQYQHTGDSQQLF